MDSTKTDDRPSETAADPWNTCFLTGMLIRYLDRLDGGADTMDYHRVMGVAEGFDHIRDPKGFLLDPNNWVPEIVLRELIQRSEAVSGLKDVTYRAALAYFSADDGRPSTLMETIAQYLGDVDLAVRSAGLWATAYCNYLRMGAFARPGECRTLHVLVRFLPPVDPSIGGSLLVKGNFEAFAMLYPFVKTATCEEEYSQLRLASIVAEFGDQYLLQPAGTTAPGYDWTITERRTKRVVATARACEAGSEPVAGWDGGTAYAVDGPSRGVIAEGPMLQIVQGGLLRVGSLEYRLHDGARFNAPYTRYRFQWQARVADVSGRAASPDESARDGFSLTDDASPKAAISKMLFEQVAGFQVTQRRLLGIIVRNKELREENRSLREELFGPSETGGLVGKSAPMQELFRLVRSVAQSDVNVLITGETGTGKEQTARLVHQLSPRRAGRFLAINCGALAETLLESELFGHERGAFTGAVAQKKGKFEQAHGGTLFLDEIGEVSPAMQVKLLRVLQERELQRVGGQDEITVDVRIVAATNQDLQALVAERKFRQDLFYRLNVFSLHISPLRERTDDIQLIAEHLLARHVAVQKKSAQGFTGEALEMMVRYRWPGNVRELENIIERAIALTDSHAALIGADLLPPTLRATPAVITAAGLNDLVERVEWPLIAQALKEGTGLTDLLKRIEWALIQRAIKEQGGNKTAAARLLGRTYRWLRKVETEREDASSQV